MTLIICPECSRKISDRTTPCPKCGCPISAVNDPGIQVVTSSTQPLKVEPELTSKKWKRVKLVAWLTIIVGLISAGFFSGSTPNGEFIGFFLAFIGVIALVVGKVGAWYTDKRTR